MKKKTGSRKKSLQRKIFPGKMVEKGKVNAELIFDNLMDTIIEYDPEFLFLPALLIAVKREERIKNGENSEEALEKIIKELNIGENSRAIKILKLSKKINNSR